MSRTWNEQEIRTAVLTYSEGCTSGKITFLDNAFGIEANCEQTVTVTVRVTLDSYNNDGDEIDSSDVAGAVESVLDDYLGDRLDCKNIDARASA